MLVCTMLTMSARMGEVKTAGRANWPACDTNKTACVASLTSRDKSGKKNDQVVVYFSVEQPAQLKIIGTAYRMHESELEMLCRVLLRRTRPQNNKRSDVVPAVHRTG